MDTGLFKCIACGTGSLAQNAEAYACGRCGARYPVRFGVPLFLKSVRITPTGQILPRETAEKICDQVQLPRDDRTIDGLRGIFSYRYDLPDLSLTAENNYFFHRVQLPEEWKPAPPPQAPLPPVNTGVRYEFVFHYVPGALPAGRVLTRNVRLRNTGPTTMSSKCRPPVQISYHWRTPSGKLVERDGPRSPLPIDLLPGRSLTVPIWIRTPSRPGPYMLELALVHEGVEWLDDDSLSVGVQIVRGMRHPVPRHWKILPHDPTTYDYGKDHERGKQMLFQELDRLGQPSPRILEVGGCNNPMTRGRPGSIYSVDIDVQTLQVGQLSVTDPAEDLHFVCADAADLPFADHSFDCIAVFSTLHHFADPPGVLRQLKRLLRPDGFLALMCEPVGCYTNGVLDQLLIRELEQGINEQVFTLAEYLEMFMQAGLYAPRVLAEGQSLKAILHDARNPAVRDAGWASPFRHNLGRIWNRMRRALLPQGA